MECKYGRCLMDEYELNQQVYEDHAKEVAELKEGYDKLMKLYLETTMKLDMYDQHETMKVIKKNNPVNIPWWKLIFY